MNRLLSSMRLAFGNRLLAGGLFASAGISMLCGAAPVLAATHTYKVIPDLNTMMLSHWTSCDTTCRNDLRSSDGVYVLPSNSTRFANTAENISAAQWTSIMAYMTNNSTWPVYSEDLYDCTFAVSSNTNVATTYSEAAQAVAYGRRLDGVMIYHEPGLPTCGSRTTTSIFSSVIDTFPSNTLDGSNLAVVGSVRPGGVSIAGKIFVHSRAYDALAEGTDPNGNIITRAQRIDAALANANTGGLLIEQNPELVSTFGWNIPYVLKKARSAGKRALLLVPPSPGEQNYLGKIHLMMKALEMDTATNLLGNGVEIVPAIYANLIGVPYATSGLPSNSLRAVMKHLKNVRAKGLSYANDSNFAVTGWLDAVERVPTGGVVIRGWACAKNWEDSINVHIYVGGVLAKGVTANRASEGPVATSCSSTGTAYRFYEFFPESARVANVGKIVQVYGISPFDLANNGLSGNGKPVP